MSYLRSFKNAFTGEPREYLDINAFVPADWEEERSGFRIEVGESQSESQLFGVPHFVEEWPRSPVGPLTCLLSIRIDELPSPLPHMPTSGWLTIFYDMTQSDFGYSPKSNEWWRVTLTNASTPIAKSPPAGSVREGIQVQFTSNMELPKDFSPYHTIGGKAVWQQEDGRPTAHFRSEEYLEDSLTIAALRDAGLPPDCLITDDRQTQINVARSLDANAIDPVRFHNGTSRWQLLLQIDTDPSANLEFIGGGRIFVLAPRDKSGMLRIEQSWIIAQCT